MTDTCPKCGAEVKIYNMRGHMDWHDALGDLITKIAEEVDKLNGVTP